MKTNNTKRVPLTGYSDRLSARPGESIEFKLSAVQPESESLNQSRPVNTWLTHCICAPVQQANTAKTKNKLCVLMPTFTYAI